MQEPMAGPVQPVVFPVMWARDASMSFLREPDAMRALIEAAGFQVRAWDDVTDEVAGPGSAAAIPAHSVQRIIMGDALDDIVRAGQQNRAERRIVMTQAVLERRAAPASAPRPRTSS
jgi:sarcosine/dimethylglycine N-methyltransferase